MVLLSNYSYAYLKPTRRVYAVVRPRNDALAAEAISNMEFLTVPMVHSAHSRARKPPPAPKKQKHWPTNGAGDLGQTAENVIVAFLTADQARLHAEACAKVEDSLAPRPRECTVQDLEAFASMMRMASAVIVCAHCPYPRSERDEERVHYEICYRAKERPST